MNAPAITQTQQVLTGMWTENTGRHMLDSGGAYGRNWERNQGTTAEAFRDQPAVTLDASYSVDITVSAWHWLDSMVEYDDYQTRVLHRWANIGDRAGESWLASMQAFADQRHASSGGQYADWPEPLVVNTYNHESWLDSTLQYVAFMINDQPYLALQYHGGCDVRGGYTAPRVFRLLDEQGGFYSLWSEGYVSLTCTAHRGQQLGTDLFGGQAHDAIHAWGTNSAGGTEWTNYGGAFVDVEFESRTNDETGESYAACPECGAPLDVDVTFV